MNKKERDSRRKTGQTVGRILGIELFEDTRIQRIAVIPAHYAAVGIPGCEIDDGHADFPLADLDQPDAANTTVMIVILRLHPGEPMTGAYQFRYHHRDSVSPADGLDLKRRWHFCLDDQKDPDKLIAQVTALLPIVQVPTILDASNLDVTEAFNAYKTMPFSFFQPTINETETVTNR